MHSIPRPRRGLGGEHGSNVLGGTVDSLDSLESDQRPHLMHPMHRQVAPRTLDPDTIPLSGASASDESNGSNASQVLALGPTFGSFDSFAPGQALTLMSLLSLKPWPWARL